MMGKEVFWVDYRLEDAFLWAGLNACHSLIPAIQPES